MTDHLHTRPPGPVPLPYLQGYPPELLTRVRSMIEAGTLADAVARRHPEAHAVRNERALFDYVQALKTRHLKSAPPLAKVAYDPKLHLMKQVLGTHTRVSRVQGGKLKAKREIRIATLFKDAPADFLRMIVVHELAHLKEPEHDRAFYALCQHMEPDYHQLELDLRLWLTAQDLAGAADEASPPASHRRHEAVAPGQGAQRRGPALAQLRGDDDTGPGHEQ